MTYSLLKKILIFAVIFALFASLFFFHPEEKYMKEIGSLIKLKGFSEEKQQNLNLEKMRPSFSPSQNP